MAGRPNIRIKRLTKTLIEALSAGQQDAAALAFAEIRRTAQEAGLEMPELPPEATEMWLQVTQNHQPGDKVQRPVETRLSEATRKTLVKAGDLAAGHMLKLMEEPNLFGPLGMIPVDKQVTILSTVMGRAFGAMPMGAQRVSSEGAQLQEDEPQQISQTLSMVIRQKQKQQQPARQMLDVTPEDGDED